LNVLNQSFIIFLPSDFYYQLPVFLILSVLLAITSHKVSTHQKLGFLGASLGLAYANLNALFFTISTTYSLVINFFEACVFAYLLIKYKHLVIVKATALLGGYYLAEAFNGFLGGIP